MKRFSLMIALITAFAMLLSSSTSFAQFDEERASKRDFHLGVGFFPDESYLGLGNSMIVPNLIFSWDYKLAEAGPGRITLGNYFSTSYYESSFFALGSSTDPTNIVTLHAGLRLGYALNPILDGMLEPYGGIGYGYNYYLSDDADYYTNVLNLTPGFTQFSIHAGVRFIPTESGKFGFFTEVATGYTSLRFGFSFRKPSN